ncbi:MAG: 4Fe-4S binding protein [Desulfobacterales bacterium]
MAEKSVYQQLAASIGGEDSPTLPKIFEMLLNENEATVLFAAYPPASAGELAEKTGLPADDVGKMMDPLFKKGVLFKSSKTDAEGMPRYYRVRALLQFHDASVLAPDLEEAFFDLWREYQDNEFPAYHKRLESALPRSAMRVIPVNIALEPDTRVAPFEDVKQIVAEARRLAVVKCPCRLVAGAPCEKSLEVCIQVNKAADYTLERGTGPELSKAQAIDLLKACEEEGLVHMVSNSRGVGHIICNCCDDCCIAWPGTRTAGINYAAPSRFTAIVDPASCTGCEECLDRCFFDAIAVDDTALIDAEKCMGCGLCAVPCPVEAISLKGIREEDFVPE